MEVGMRRFTSLMLIPGVCALLVMMAVFPSQAEGLPGVDDFVTVDEMPEMTHQESPVYPEAEKEKGIEGEVWVKALVGKDGKVAQAVLGKSSGVQSFDDEALKAAWKCTYTPAKIDGKPIATWVTYRVEFKLDGEKGKKEKGADAEDK